MNGWAVKEVGAYPAGAQTVGAGQTNALISLEGWPITAGGATQGIVVKIKVSGVTVATAITAKLQTAIGSDYEDVKTVAITANGSYYIRLLPTVTADQPFMPLLNKGQVVLTTGAGDTATIQFVGVLQDL
jgi:hypothetical protein